MYRVLSKAKCNATPMMTDQGQRQDSTEGKGATEARKEGRKGSSRRAHRRERHQVRRDKRKEGGRKKEKGADEAGKPAQSYRIYKFYSRCTFLVMVRLVDRC